MTQNATAEAKDVALKQIVSELRAVVAWWNENTKETGRPAQRAFIQVTELLARADDVLA